MIANTGMRVIKSTTVAKDRKWESLRERRQREKQWSMFDSSFKGLQRDLLHVTKAYRRKTERRKKRREI